MNQRPALAIMARTPRRRQTKTRLAAVLGDEQAQQAHATLVQDTLRRMQGLGDVDVSVWVTELDDIARGWVEENGFALRLQPAGDLGRRMHHLLEDLLTGGATRACVMGTDCPLIDAAYVRRAMATLSATDVVVAPAEDGGYGLLGVKEPCAELFDGIAWGTGNVLAQTLERVEQLGRTFVCLETIWDVDTAADWRRYLAWREARS